MLLWFVFASSLLALGIGCLMPARFLPPLPNDKLLHFTAFALLTLLASRLVDTVWQLAWACAGLLVLGWVIECLQRWVPGRSFCWRDLLANAAGIACAASLVLSLEFFFLQIYF